MTTRRLLVCAAAAAGLALAGPALSAPAAPPAPPQGAAIGRAVWLGAGQGPATARVAGAVCGLGGLLSLLNTSRAEVRGAGVLFAERAPAA